jgi:hypothetical protein
MLICTGYYGKEASNNAKVRTNSKYTNHGHGFETSSHILCPRRLHSINRSSDMSIITRLPVSLFEFKRNRFFVSIKLENIGLHGIYFVTSKHVVQDESGKYLGTFSYD